MNPASQEASSDLDLSEPETDEEDTAPILVNQAQRPPQPFGGKPAQEQETRRMEVETRPPQREVDTQATQVSSTAYTNQLPQARSQPDQYGNQSPTSRTQNPYANSLPADYAAQSRRTPQGSPHQGYPATSDPRAASGRSSQAPVAYPPRTSRPPVQTPPPAKKPKNPKKFWGCLARAVFSMLFVFIMILLCGSSIAFYQYYRIASQLPDIQDLRTRASQFETTRILDRNGNILYEILDPNAGRRTYVPLDKISPYLVAATIATEDKGFYSHPGFDIFAIARAFVQNYQGGETISGASTITQQLARALLFSPEERVEQSYQRKMREAILAAEITRRYSKDEILELYLNEIYYSNLAYGIQAASETYFRTSAGNLTLGQAAFLAGLPQAPGIYDVYSNPDVTFSRMEDVLVLMFQTSQEQGCIYVSNSPQPVCLTVVDVTRASDEVKNFNFQPPKVEMRYPHWVTYIRSLLEAQYDAQTIYRSGFSVYTTIDPAIQDIAEQAIQEQVAAMVEQRATGGALVAIKPNSGEILAMVGSADFYNEAASGQVNMAISPRQPGSSIKPFTYLAAFEKGWTPSTLIWDVPSEFSPSGLPNDPMPPYIPVNYDGRFHGPVTVRSALANSYNIPAVKTLQFVGVNDDPNTPQPEGLVGFARRLGITTLTRNDYGLSLTLGGGDVTLLELTQAYATLANYGRRIPPVAITRILDHQGQVVFEYIPQPGEQVVRVEHAFLISSILSDNQARTPAFGPDSVLRLPFPAAVKTGTTNDFRDNWTMGYNPDLAIGVWIGNADYTPMQNTSGLQGAAPVWAKVMQAAIQQQTGGNPTPFTRPGSVVERVVCEISGAEPSKWCPKERVELFAADQMPLPKEQDLWQEIFIDTWTGLRASAACSDFIKEQFVINVTDEYARRWLRRDPQGQAWLKKNGFEPPLYFAPTRECRADDPRPILGFPSPRNGETITVNPLPIYAVIDATQYFDFFRLEYGLGEKPDRWELLGQGKERFRNPELLYEWDVSDIPPGVITLRLTLFSTEDTYAEVEIRLNLQVPTPTPTPTMTPTATPTMTPTTPASPTPLPSATPMPTMVIIPSTTPAPSSTPGDGGGF